MWMHLRLGGGFLLLVLAGSGSTALGQSSLVADRADTGIILRPADGERVPPFRDGRAMLLKIGLAARGRVDGGNNLAVCIGFRTVGSTCTRDTWTVVANPRSCPAGPKPLLSADKSC